MKTRDITGLGLACLLAGAGCRVVGPNAVPPTVASPPAWQEAAPPGWQTAQPNDAAAKGAWWEVYGDARLSGLEAQVENNFSLQTAQAQYLQARALIRFYRAQALPTLTVGAQALPERESANRPLALGTGAATFNDLVIPFDVTWEPDLWGQAKRATEEQSDVTGAAAAEVANLRLSLQAEVALDYFAVGALDAQAALLARSTDTYQQALDLTRTRHAGGVVSEVDVAQAETQLETARAQAEDVQVARAQYEHALAVLTGRPPEGFHLAPQALAGEPPAVPLGVPAALLERRPDIAAAERQVAAANAAIGVAMAAFYPNITLSAGAGLESTAIGNLFTLPSTMWALGASAVQTLDTGGKRRAVETAAKINHDATVDTYRETVLEAFEEVEDNLSALRLLTAESATQQAAVAAAQHSLDLSNIRYKGGVTTYLEVTTAQTADLADERAGLDLLARRMQASVLLIKALGGGWNVAQLPALPGQ